VRLLPNGDAKIEELHPLKHPDGGRISGLPTTKPATDVPYDVNLNPLPFDEDSLDAEGITIDGWGNFWVCEEYKPSVAMVAPNGKVLLRLVPEGTLTGADRVRFETLVSGEWLLQASTGLVSWNTLSTNASRRNVLDFLDPAYNSSPGSRFYRAKRGAAGLTRAKLSPVPAGRVEFWNQCNLLSQVRQKVTTFH
jgi:hypothetical protein